MRNTGDILKPLIRLGENQDECWEWLGKISKKTGYGQKQFDGKTVLAHRWVFQFFNGWLPSEAVLNHLCSNRRCVNPKHLEITTSAGNCRHGRGTKLTLSQAKEIKSLVRSLKWGGRKHLASKYGVSVELISDIKYGRAWSEI